MLCFVLSIQIQKTAEAARHKCIYKKCSEKMQQIYSRTPMPNWDFNNLNPALA